LDGGSLNNYSERLLAFGCLRFAISQESQKARVIPVDRAEKSFLSRAHFLWGSLLANLLPARTMAELRGKSK
jgi:hypothetical protein